MAEPEDKLNELQTRLFHLEKYEAAFKRELADIRAEIFLLKSQSENSETRSPAENEAEETPKIRSGLNQVREPVIPSANHAQPKQTESPFKPEMPVQPSSKANIEKFIGENLISKIGVIILIIGVAIGTKYAIDNNLISPLLRIICGYLVGLILVGLAVKLKSRYLNYSAVLMSGGMAIMYFITYFAYSFYDLISQPSAFALMVIFTVFTVLAAVLYERQVIAHIGLVGAYAVPFLLSEGTGRITVLFSYTAIINIGILAISVKKYWKSLFYNSFLVTWLIYSAWFLDKYVYQEHFGLALFFLGVFFTTFHLTFIAYKVIHKEVFGLENVALILANSFLFYGLGYSILDNPVWHNFLGLFTVMNAVIHFVVGFALHGLKLGEKTAFHLVIALVLTFLTISVPVQFDGNRLTLLWIGEAVFLFIIGRTKKIGSFELYAYPLMALASISLLNDWQNTFFGHHRELPFYNGNFITSLTAAAGFGIICLIDRDERYRSAVSGTSRKIIRFLLPTIFLLILYNTFRTEIGNYFNLVEPRISGDLTPYAFNFIWQLNYTIFFLTVLSFANIGRIRSAVLGMINLALNALIVAVFLSFGLLVLHILSIGYINQTESVIIVHGVSSILIRYVSFGILAGIFLAGFKYTGQDFLTKIIRQDRLVCFVELGLSSSLLVIISSELFIWSEYFGVDEITKLGLSIFFGVYALILIVVGILQKKKHLRYFAIVVFGITLIKLFIYDLAELETIPKTVVFVSIGILLLIVSFIYTKYKNLIFDDEMI